MDDPYRFDYEFEQIIPGILMRLDFHIGFKVQPKINLYFKEALEDLVQSGEINLESSYESLKKHNFPGDFKFILIERIMIRDNKLIELGEFCSDPEQYCQKDKYFRYQSLSSRFDKYSC